MNETITVNELINNLSIYQELITHINFLETNSTVKNGAVYLRVSTDTQTEFSPEAQLEDILKYCISNNIMVDKDNIFLEPGISGRRADKRPQFQKMISKAQLRERPFDVILVHKLDRFARNREDSIVYKSMLRKKYNIDIIAVKELLPEDKKLAMMMESQLETWGEYYSMNLSDEVYKGLVKKANRGEHSSRPPLGYDKVVKEVIRDNGKEKIIREMVINDSEAEIVRLIFEKFANGESQLEITRYLNSLGIKTKYNGKFSDRAISWILHNPVYIGYMRWTKGGMDRDWYKTDIISKKADFEPIISHELWDKVQNKLKDMNEIYSKKTRQFVKHEHWLRGLIRCDSCGNVIVKCNNSFQCTGYTHGKCNVSHYASVKAIESAILNQLENDFKNKPINIEISPTLFTNDSEISILNSQLDSLEQKEKRVKIAYENGIDSLEEYKENKNRLENEKKKVISKIEELSNQNDIKTIREKIFKKCHDAYDILIDKEVSNSDKSLISHQLFEKIIYSKNEQKLLIYYK